MERLEYKYVLPLSRLDELRRRILPYVQGDLHAHGEPFAEYTVRSLYFDTAALDFYEEKVEGVRERMKIRIRAYNDYTTDATSFLEIKKKTGRVISKHRALIPYRNVEPLLSDGDVARHVPCNNAADPQHDIARHFLFHFYTRSLQPCVTNIFEREAYLCRWNNAIRLTIDKNLRFQTQGSVDALFERNDAFYAMPNRFVFEVKTHLGIPCWLKRVLGQFDVLQEAVSKYVTCVFLIKEQGNRYSTTYHRIVHDLKGEQLTTYANRI